MLFFLTFFLPVVGVFEADILSSYIGGEPAPVSNKLDADFSAFVASFYGLLSTLLGLRFAYSRGIVLYGIGISLLLILAFLKASAKLRSMVGLVALPLFARGIMRIGDLDLVKFTASFFVGSAIGFLCCTPIILVIEFALRTYLDSKTK